jgi:hypothetical protein
VTVDITAPVSGGEFRVGPDGTDLTLRLALDGLRTGNFVTQTAARSVVARYDARVLTYQGLGADPSAPWSVDGHAVAASIDLILQLTITPSGPLHDPMREIDVVGDAQVGTFNLPIPGMGTAEDFSFDVAARLALRPRR